MYGNFLQILSFIILADLNVNGGRIEFYDPNVKDGHRLDDDAGKSLLAQGDENCLKRLIPSTTIRNSSFYSKISKAAKGLYDGANPIRYLKIDGIFPEHIAFMAAREVASESETDFSTTSLLLDHMRSKTFLQFIYNFTGHGALFPEPTYGVHRIRHGEKMPLQTTLGPSSSRDAKKRQLSVLVYLSESWDVMKWNGALELWGIREPDKDGIAIAPTMNRMIAFETAPHSWYGHPSMVTCPTSHSLNLLIMHYTTQSPMSMTGNQITTRQQSLKESGEASDATNAPAQTTVIWESSRDHGSLPSFPGVKIFRPEEIASITRTTLPPLLDKQPERSWSCGNNTTVYVVHGKEDIITFAVDNLLSIPTLRRLEQQAKNKSLMWTIEEAHLGPPSQKRTTDRQRFSSHGYKRELSLGGYNGLRANPADIASEVKLLQRCLRPVFFLVDKDFEDKRKDRFDEATYSLAHPISAAVEEVDVEEFDRVVNIVYTPRRPGSQALKEHDPPTIWPRRTHLPHIDVTMDAPIGYAGVGALSTMFNSSGTGIYKDQGTGTSLFLGEEMATPILKSYAEHTRSDVTHFTKEAPMVNPFGYPHAINNSWVSCIMINYLLYGRFYFYDLRRLHNFYMEAEDIKKLSFDPAKGRLTYNLFFMTSNCTKSNGGLDGNCESWKRGGRPRRQ